MNDVAMFLAYINELATILRKHSISVHFARWSFYRNWSNWSFFHLYFI